MSNDDDIREHRKALRKFAGIKEGLEYWTIKEHKIYHIPCDNLIGFGMIIRHQDWGDGYCVMCGANIPEEMIRKMLFVIKMEEL